MQTISPPNPEHTHTHTAGPHLGHSYTLFAGVLLIESGCTGVERFAMRSIITLFKCNRRRRGEENSNYRLPVAILFVLSRSLSMKNRSQKTIRTLSCVLCLKAKASKDPTPYSSPFCIRVLNLIWLYRTLCKRWLVYTSCQRPNPRLLCNSPPTGVLEKGMVLESSTWCWIWNWQTLVGSGVLLATCTHGWISGEPRRLLLRPFATSAPLA